MSSLHVQQPTVKPDASEPRELPAWSPVALTGLVLLCASLPYLNTLLNGFVHDDNRQVLANPYIRSFRHLPEIFGTTVWSFLGAQGFTNYYRPMMTLGYLLCYQFFGQLPYGFHLVNVALHVAVVYVLFRLTEKLFRDRILAAIAAAVFALHPIHTESVAWIAAVTDLELTFFYLLTFWFYVEVARPDGGRSDRVQLAMVGSFVLTILSKEQALTFPLLAMVYEHGYRDDRSDTTMWQKLGRYGVLWLLASAYLLFRIRLLGALAPVLQKPNLTWYETVLSGFALVEQYVGKLLWPAKLCAFYVFRKSLSLLDPRVLAGVAAMALGLVLFRLLWKRARLASFGMLWMFITLAPVLNARWMAANVFTERYLYLPSVGFCWLMAWSWFELWRLLQHHAAVWRWACVLASLIILSLAFVRIVTRNREWRTEEVLFARTLAASPDAYPIRTNLGAAFWERGDVKSAEREWLTMLKTNPKDAIVLSDLGLVALKEKRYTEAADFFRRSMRVKPNYTESHVNLGSAYLEMGETDRAELQFRAAVALSPLNARAHDELGKILMGAGRLQEAEEQFRLSVESTPNVAGYDALGDIYRSWDQPKPAERAYREALSLDEFDSHAHFNLGSLYAAAGQTAEAVREYQAGLVTDPSNPEALAALKKLAP